MDEDEGEGGPKKRERSRRILEAAAALMQEKGAAGVSLEEIADRAGVVRRTLYNHFPSKDSLFCAMTVPMRRRLGARIEAFASGPKAGGDPLEELSRFLFSLWSENSSDIELFSERSLAAYPALHAEYEAFKASFRALFMDARLLPRLRLDPEASAELAYACILPLGSSLRGRKDYEREFVEAMMGLLEKTR
jgi:AcrR family transcriptional regulator